MDDLVPGPGYVRVLVERPKDRDLAKAAEALLQGKSPIDFINRYDKRVKLSKLVLDPSFGALPIGPGGGAKRRSPEAWAPDKSKKFLVRGFIKPGSGGKLPATIDGGRIYSDLPIYGATCIDSRAVGDADTVRANLDTATLAAHGLDGSGVALAIADTGIFLPRITQPLGSMGPTIPPPALDAANSWTSNEFTTTKPGMHRLGHGTMCTYDALIAAPKATLLDLAILIARPLGDHTVQATIGAAMQAYYLLIWKWAIQPLSGVRPPYPALVVNNSWGIYHPSLDVPPATPGRYIDNPIHPFRDFIGLLTDAGVDIVFASGNCGAQCAVAACLSRTDGTIMGANAYDEVLTVAGCDTEDALVGYSSQGPSIANMPQNKPDVTAYTHFLGSKSERIFIPDSGTSAACAVAAGCIAALRTKLPPDATSPAALIQVLKDTAHRVVGSGWHPDYGYGIIDPVAAAKKLGLI